MGPYRHASRFRPSCWSAGATLVDNGLMVKAPVSDAPEPGPARRSRRGSRRWRLLAALALVLWLAGRGLGLLGGAPMEGPAPPEAAAKPSPDAGKGGGDSSGDGARVAPATVAEAKPDHPTPPAPAGEAAAGTAIDGDQFASLLSLVDLRLDQGEVGRALAVLGELESRPLTEPQRDAAALRRQLAGQAAGGVLAEVRAWLRSGDVRLAAGSVRALLEGGASTAALLAELPCGADPARPVPHDEGTWRAPEPLAKGRAVRVLQGGLRRVGTIVDSRSDRVTLRIATGQGVTFPTVELAAVEPLEPTVGEAVSMAWASLHANDPLGARLWLACAELRGEGQAQAGVAELAQLIR